MGETQSGVKILPRLLRSGSTGNIGLGLRSEHSYSHFRRTHTSGVFTRLAWACFSRSIRHARCTHFAALLTHLTWARCSRGIRHTRRGLFTALLTRLAWARCSCGIHHTQRGCGSSHTPCVGSLFSSYPSCPAWSLRCFSHMPCMGSLFSRYPSRPAWSRCGFSHTPCVGSVFWGGMVAAPLTGIER